MLPTETHDGKTDHGIRLRARLNDLYINKQLKRIVDGETKRIELIDEAVSGLRLRLGLRSQIDTGS
jgi:hypothetical protein